MARTRSAIEADIRACQGRIAELEGVLSLLKAFQERLSTDHGNLRDDVKTPVDDYDLAENKDWEGLNETEAENRRTSACGSLAGYDGEVSSLEGDIATAISNVNRMIIAEYSRLDSLRSELASCDDHYDR